MSALQRSTLSPRPRVRKAEKSEQTLAAIVATGFEIAKAQGLQAVSLTSVAKALGISKGGVALRAGSLEQLQHMVVDVYEAQFIRAVYEPAMQQPRGVARLDALVHGWMAQGIDLNTLIGSLYGMCAFHMDSAPQPLRARLLQGFRRWQETLEFSVRQAIQMQHLRSDTDAEQLVFEIFGLMVSFSYAELMLRKGDGFARAKAAYGRLMWPYRSINP